MVVDFPKRPVAILCLLVLCLPTALFAQSAGPSRAETVKQKLKRGSDLRFTLSSQAEQEAKMLSLDDRRNFLKVEIYNKRTDRFTSQEIPIADIQELIHVKRKKNLLFPLAGGLLSTFTFFQLGSQSFTEPLSGAGVLGSAEEFGTDIAFGFFALGFVAFTVGAILGFLVAPVSETETTLWSDS